MDIKFGEKLIKTIEIAGHKIPADSILHISITYHVDTSNASLEIITNTEPNTIELHFDSLEKAITILQTLAGYNDRISKL